MGEQPLYGFVNTCFCTLVAGSTRALASRSPVRGLSLLTLTAPADVSTLHPTAIFGRNCEDFRGVRLLGFWALGRHAVPSICTRRKTIGRVFSKAQPRKRPAPLEDPLYLFRRRATGLLDIRDPGPLPDPDESRLAPGMPSCGPQEPGWVPAPESSDILRSPENTFPVERPSSQLRLPPILGLSAIQLQLGEKKLNVGAGRHACCRKDEEQAGPPALRPSGASAPQWHWLAGSCSCQGQGGANQPQPQLGPINPNPGGAKRSKLKAGASSLVLGPTRSYVH
eukprot:scaffold9347_cov110-Isochrysis_galbana.AAC.6